MICTAHTYSGVYIWVELVTHVYVFSFNQKTKEVIGQPKGGCQRDFKLTVFAFDNDSKLNTDQSKEELRKAGLSDELDVGRWIAEKLQEYEENDLSQNVIRFIDEKQTSTLNKNWVSMSIFIALSFHKYYNFSLNFLYRDFDFSLLYTTATCR